MLESKIESKVCGRAKLRGFLTFKLWAFNRIGMPDRIFLRYGEVFFIEFKAKGKTPGKIQQIMHDRIRSHGFEVFVIDSVEVGIDLIDALSCDDDV